MDMEFTLEALYQQFSKVREYLYTSINYIAIPILSKKEAYSKNKPSIRPIS
jgi:hypothetical protein